MRFEMDIMDYGTLSLGPAKTSAPNFSLVYVDAGDDDQSYTIEFSLDELKELRLAIERTIADYKLR